MTLADNSDTFRDLLPSGHLVYSARPIDRINDYEPPVAAGAMRIGVTRTESGNIVTDFYLGNYRVRSGANPGDPFKV